MSQSKCEPIRAIRWRGDYLELLDQRKLPGEEIYLRLDRVSAVGDAIRDMVVRGAPAIGITAAYGVVLAVRARHRENPTTWRDDVRVDFERLAKARPTAVNLSWALQRMADAMARTTDEEPVAGLLDEARAIHEQDVTANRRMGVLGSRLLTCSGAVLTHCNTGSLATGGFGTALGVVREGFSRGRITQVYADETRPWLQGSRLTAWELARDGIPVTLLADGAAAWLMRQGEVRWVIVGADRIAANGDTANKIGTYGLAVLARQHAVGFMVVAPTSTIDLSIIQGEQIAIEERDPSEILRLGDRAIAPERGVGGWNPAFDVTPAELIDAIVTENGVVENPDDRKIAALCDGD